jgi:acetate kinase
MRKLRDSKNPLAQEAINLFTYRIIRESGAMIACLGGLNVISFSGGIGEHDIQIRASVCEKLEWLGIEIDKDLNSQAVGNLTIKISSPQSKVEVWVVPTDEGIMIAQEALSLLRS